MFPFSESVYFSSNSVYAGVWLSRRRFPAGAFDDRMDDDERIELLNKLGLRTEKPRNLPIEKQMTATLANAATGGLAPRRT